HFVDQGVRRWPVARSVAKAVYEAHPENAESLTAYASILRRSGKASEAMDFLKAAGERFREHRSVMYEWSTVAGATHDNGLGIWLSGRSLADARDSMDPIRFKLSLAGLGVGFRQLFQTTKNKAFAAGQAACGQLGLRLEE